MQGYGLVGFLLLLCSCAASGLVPPLGWGRPDLGPAPWARSSLDPAPHTGYTPPRPNDSVFRPSHGGQFTQPQPSTAQQVACPAGSVCVDDSQCAPFDRVDIVQQPGSGFPGQQFGFPQSSGCGFGQVCCRLSFTVQQTDGAASPQQQQQQQQQDAFPQPAGQPGLPRPHGNFEPPFAHRGPPAFPHAGLPYSQPPHFVPTYYPHAGYPQYQGYSSYPPRYGYSQSYSPYNSYGGHNLYVPYPSYQSYSGYPKFGSHSHHLTSPYQGYGHQIPYSSPYSSYSAPYSPYGGAPYGAPGFPFAAVPFGFPHVSPFPFAGQSGPTDPSDQSQAGAQGQQSAAQGQAGQGQPQGHSPVVSGSAPPPPPPPPAQSASRTSRVF